MYEYLIGSLMLLLIWSILFYIRRDLKEEILYASFLCMPLGLSEIFFIPYYWNPSRLFNLNPDIESLIFCFAVGGIASVLYEELLRKKLSKNHEKKSITYMHCFILFITLLVSVIFFTTIFHRNLIYTAIISMVLGAIVLVVMRRDLFAKTIIGGTIFVVVYTLLLWLITTFIYPHAIGDIWNTKQLTGATFINLPIEEILFAFSFGLLWSPIYELGRGYKIAALRR